MSTPIGTLSKNSQRGALIKASIILLWIVIAVFTHSLATVKALRNAKIPIFSEKSENISR